MAASRAPKVDQGLLDEFHATSGRHYGRCPLGKLIESLDPAQAKAIQTALDDPAISSKAIVVVLKRRELASMSHYTVSKHRKGECNCGQNN